MSERRDSDEKERLLDGILGLGRESARKSYYPELQKTIAELKEAEKQVKEINENLENIVEQRTAELENTYDQLIEARSRLLKSEKLTGLAELTARVAHELSTPLGMAVTGFSRLEELLADGCVDEDISGLFSLVHRNLERASVLIKSFQNLAADQASDLRREFLLNEILDEVSVTMGGQLAKTRQKIFIDCPEGILIDGYPGAFVHIFTNLIANSRKHGYPDKSHGRIQISVSPQLENVTITYSDDGCGMDDETMKYVFEPFFTTRRDEGNTGLGMSLVYNLVTTTLGGSLNLESSPGNGVRMVFELPLVSPERGSVSPFYPG